MKQNEIQAGQIKADTTRKIIGNSNNAQQRKKMILNRFLESSELLREIESGENGTGGNTWVILTGSEEMNVLKHAQSAWE